jgi:hypothetical protein
VAVILKEVADPVRVWVYTELETVGLYEVTRPAVELVATPAEARADNEVPLS